MTVDIDHLRRTTIAGHVTATLAFAAYTLDNDLLLAQLAQSVADTDWTRPPERCPLCEQDTCTPGCPLENARR